MGGAYTTGEVNLTAGNRPLRVRSISVDAHLLNTLGVQPAQGRFFSEEETDRAGASGATARDSLMQLWQTVFGGQPLVGQTVNVEGRPRNPWHHAIRHRCHGQPHGNLVAPRAPCGYSSEPRLPHPPCHWAPEGRRHGAGGADRVERIPRELGRCGSSGPHERIVVAADHTLQMQPVQDAIVGDAAVRSGYCKSLSGSFC